MTITTESAPPPGDAQEPPSSGTGRRGPLVVAVIAVVAVLALLGWFLFIRDDGTSSSGLPSAKAGSTGTVPPPASKADPDTVSLEALLQKGHTVTFHATYAATGDADQLGGALTVEVWRKDGKTRQDTTSTRQGATYRTAGLVLGDTTTTCSKQDKAPWSCSSSPDPGTNPDGVFGSVAAELQGKDVVASDEQVAGHDAKCFSFPTGDSTEASTGKVCISPQGIPLSLSANGQQLTLSDLSTSVDDSVFTPPNAS